ncbi:MAG: hypothetical protein ACRYFU_16850 [Janthinobacterium lividum]
MPRHPHVLSSLIASLLFATAGLAAAQSNSAPGQGLFPGGSNIGDTQPGSTAFDPTTGNYQVKGGGFDVWSTHDDFHLTWVKFTGDGSLTADVQVAQPAVHAKAKGVLMFRQSLDTGSAYADVALHGDGHIDIQWRATNGGETKDTDLPEHGTTRVRIVRKGDIFTAYALTGEKETPAAPSVTVPMHGTVYVGLGVCSHSTTELQTVTFTNVKLEPAASILASK